MRERGAPPPSPDDAELLPSSAIASAATASAGPGSEERRATFISFESQRRLLADEVKEFRESRFTICNLRATPASFLFPALYPIDPDHPDGYRGYRPGRTRLAPLPVPHDADGSIHPLLAELEAAVCLEEQGGKDDVGGEGGEGGEGEGQAGELLRQFGLWPLRHRAIQGMSTGEARKLMIVDALCARSRLVVLDEAFDGLDRASCEELPRAVGKALERTEWGKSVVAQITHRPADLESIEPTHVLLLGQGESGTGYHSGSWEAMRGTVDTYFEQQRREHPHYQMDSRSAGGQPRRSYRKGGTVDDDGGGESPLPSPVPSPLVEFEDVTIKYDTEPVTVVLDGLNWTVREGENWSVLGGNGSGKTTILDLITGENVLGYQQQITLFGRKKGSGESLGSIKKQLGMLSTGLHMQYTSFAGKGQTDPDHIDHTKSAPAANGNGNRARQDPAPTVTCAEVVYSGFFDSIGLVRCSSC